MKRALSKLSMCLVLTVAVLVAPSNGYAQTLEDAYQHVWDANGQNLQRPPQSPEWFSTLANRSADQYDAAMINCLAAAMNVWVADPGEEERIVCEDIIGRVPQRPAGVGNLTASVYFAAAQAAEIVGSPDQAMALLREAVNVCGTQPAPGAEQVTVNVVGNIWLGRVANEAGLAEDAIAAYGQAAESVDRSQPGLQDIRAWCMLYSGEIQARKGDTDAARDALAQVEAIMASAVRSELPHLQSEWGRRIMEEITKGASESVAPPKAYLPADMAADLQGKLNGSSLRPMSGIFHETDRNGLLVTAIERAISRSQSAITKELGQVRLGELHMKAQRWTEAEAVFRGLYEGNAFLAPFAGLRLTECLAKLNRAGDGAAVHKEMRERWPAYHGVDAADSSGRYAKTKDAAWQNAASATAPPQPSVPVASPPASSPPGEQAAPEPGQPTPTPRLRQAPEGPAEGSPRPMPPALYYAGAVALGGLMGITAAWALLKRRRSARANHKAK